MTEQQRNQEKTEPIPPSPAHDAPPDEPGTSRGPGAREEWAIAPPSSAPSGDVAGVPVPGTTPMEGTSEGVAPVQGIAFPAMAPEFLADGENDVSMPSTTTF